VTDRDLLELIAQKVSKMDGDISGVKDDITGIKNEITGMKSEITGIKNEITGMKSEITGIKNEITGIKSEIAGMKSDIMGMKGEIKELKQSQAGFQTKLDLVSEQTAGLIEFRTEVLSRLDSTLEIQKSLLEMYGAHEAEIRALRRRPV
jgi:archaellum component FlaC